MFKVYFISDNAHQSYSPLCRFSVSLTEESDFSALLKLETEFTAARESDMFLTKALIHYASISWKIP